MKKIIAVALLSAFVAAPSFADDSAKKPVKKPAAARTAILDHCDDEHGAYHGMMGDHGMMGEHGMMMGSNMYRVLNLTDDQRAKIGKLSDGFNHDNWAKQGLINDESAKLRVLYEADKRDPAAIGEEYKKIFDLKRQMIESYLNTQNQIEEILTPEQRAQMKDLQRHHMYMHPMH